MKNSMRVLRYCDFPKSKHHLLRAILNYGGNPSAFARGLGIHQNKVYTWIDKEFVAPPAQYCRKIEQLTSGEVTCEQLRPDVFGDPLIVENTIENRFKRCIGMLRALEADIEDEMKKLSIKNSKKRGG